MTKLTNAPLLILIVALMSGAAAQTTKEPAAGGASAAPPPASVRIPQPPDCPPYQVKPGTPVSTAEQTRAVAMSYYAAGKRENVEEMDAIMTPDATIWFAGYGCADRSKWASAHYDKGRPKSTFVGVELKSLLVEGDEAVLEMVTEQAWPGGGYLKYHSIHVRVSNGKIVSLRQYSVDAKPLNVTGPMGRAPQTK
jgi:ketosteroid isomerase-like protein